MYTLVSAIGKPLSGDGHWVSVDISAIPISDIYSTYAHVYAVLSNPFLQNPVSLNLDDVRGQIGGLSITFPEWLTDNGANTLPTSDTIPSIQTRYAKYSDAVRAGYKVTPVSPVAAADAELPVGAKTWLYLTRPNTDFALFAKSCMVSVNGFFHLVDGNATGAWIADGMASVTKSHQNQVGIVSFRELGNLTYVPITADMLYKQTPDQRFRDRTYIDVGQDVSNKTVMLVLGGYLHVLDQKTFYQVGERTFAIDFDNLSLLERYQESLPYLDLSSLPIQRTDQNPTQIGVDDFLSDENLTAYLTLSQSFLVLLDNTEVFVEYDPVKVTKMPGMLISYVEPWYPLMTGIGKVSEYWSTYEDGQWSLTVYDNTWKRRVFDTVNPYTQQSIAGECDPMKPVMYSQAAFLKIGTDLTA